MAETNGVRKRLPLPGKYDPNICTKCLDQDDDRIKLDRKERCKLCKRRFIVYKWKSSGRDDFTKMVMCLPCSERGKQRVCQVCSEPCPPKPRWKRLKPSTLPPYCPPPPPPEPCPPHCVSHRNCFPVESRSGHASLPEDSIEGNICPPMHRLSLETSVVSQVGGGTRN